MKTRFSTSVAKSWMDAALSFLYPEVCQLCERGRAGPSSGFVCQDCHNSVKWLETPFCERCGLPFPGDITTPFECSNCRDAGFAFSFARSAVLAKTVVLDAIHKYKYQRALHLEPFLTSLFARAVASSLSAQDWDCLVPVPLHPTKQREREFNQAERLALALQRITGIPVQTRLIKRVVATRTQTRLSRQDRLDNMRGAFAVREEADLTARRVVIIDDVFTTGATTSACARVLRDAGAAEVCVWTLARGS